MGGEESAVELRLAGGRRDVHEVAFHAERWTRNAPFAFRVEVHERKGWRVAYDGTEEVRVGRSFLSHVRVPVQAEVDRLRFVCTAPEGKGILIDDLELVEPAPMELVSCTTVQPILPVLVGNGPHPVASIELVTRGNLDPLALEEVVVDLAGTTRVEDFEQVALIVGEGDAPFGKAQRPKAGELVFRGRRELAPGRNVLTIVVTPRATADVDGFVDASCLRLRLADDRAIEPEVTRPPARQRLGIALRDAGDDEVAVYRIPGLATTNAGTLIAVYDVRWKSWGDLPGDIDVGMSRSTDGGRSWEPMRIVMDMGDDEKWRGDGIGDPAVLVDRATGAVFVAAVWSHGNRGWNGSGPGVTPEETGQLMIVRSDDDGVTWSKPHNLTRMLKRPEWCFLLAAPGRGITMHDGTLVFPAQFQLSPDEKRMPHSTVIWSKDHGETWHIGTGVKANTTESAVVELEDGTLMLNMRDNRGGARSVYVTDDLGATWTEHPTTRRALPEPVCMASLLHVGRELTGEADGLLLFSNPAVPKPPRRRMTIKASPDLGGTWPATRKLLLDEGRSAGYSCLTMVDEKTVGILYESSRAHLAFQRIPLSELH